MGVLLRSLLGSSKCGARFTRLAGHDSDAALAVEHPFLPTRTPMAAGEFHSLRPVATGHPTASASQDASDPDNATLANECLKRPFFFIMIITVIVSLTQ